MAARARTDVLLLITGRVGLLAASAASLHLTTRLLGPAEVGRLQLLLATIGLAALLLSGTGHFFQRHAATWLAEGSLQHNLRRYVGWLFAAGSCAGIVVALLPAVWWPVSTAWLVLLLAGQLVLTTWQQALLHLLNLLSMRVAYVLLGNLVAWGGLMLAVMVTLAGGALAPHWLLGLLLAQALVLWPATRLLSPAWRHRTPMPRSAPAFSAGPVARFATPLVLGSALYWVQRSLPMPWLAQAAGLAELGRLSVGYSLGMLAMLAFDTLFRDIAGPRYDRAMAAAASHAGRVQAWETYAAALLPAATAAALCLAAAGPALLALVADPAFHDAARFVVWGAACQLCLTCQGMVQLQAAGVQDNRRLVLPQAAGALATALLLWLPWDGLPSTRTACALLAGPLLTTALAAWRMQALHAARWPWRRMAAAAGGAAPALLLAWLQASLLVLALLAGFGLALQWWLARSWLLPGGEAA